MKADAAKKMTVEDAYAMGFRHISDMAAMNRLAELLRDDQTDSETLRLFEAWRQGAMVAQAMLERARTVVN